MNYMQKAWLKVLHPVVVLVNDKLSKKSGMLGKISRLFAFGPRQFGYHPSTRLFLFMSAMIKQNLVFFGHKYPYLRELAFHNYVGIRTMTFFSIFGKYLLPLVVVTKLVPSGFYQEQGTTLQDLRNQGLPAHFSSLNDRVSAHYTEINSLYHWQMVKKFEQREKQILKQRATQRDQVKKTRFARPGYKYIEAHSNVN